MATEATKIPFVEAAAPSTPAASRVVVYAKSDGLMYSKDDAGTETLMSGGVGGLSDHDHTGGGDGGDLDSPVIDGYAVLNEEAAPGTAGAGTVRLYAKTDGLLYSKDDAGTETLVSGGSGGTPRKCLVHNSAGQSINASSETTATFDTEDSDTSGIHSAGTFTPPAGDWRVTVNFAWAASTSGNYRAVYLKKNGTTYVATDTRGFSASTGYAAGSVSYEFWGLSGTDTFQVRVVHNAASAINFGDGTILTSVSVTEIL